MFARISLLLLSAPSLLAVPIHESIQALNPRLLSKSSLNVTDGNFDPLAMIGQFCQGSGAEDQCGSGNCESWSTGDKSDGSNAGRIYCNDQGKFCWTDGSNGDCYDVDCMDKSVDTKVLSFEYSTQTSSAPIPEVVFVHYINNILNITVTGNYIWQKQVQTQYQWQWSVTSSVSATIGSTVGLPDVCSENDSVTTSISTTAGQTQTNSNITTWSSQQDYSVPAQTSVKLVYSISKSLFTVPYTQTVQFGGNMGLWCSGSVNGHHYWMPDSGSIVSASPLCNGNVCTFSGTFTGIQGVTDSVTYSYCDLGVEC